MSPLRAGRDGVVLAVHVQPGARREGAGPLHGDRLRVRVHVPPEGGRANERVVELVAELFGLRRSDVHVIAGQTSRQKDLSLDGIDLTEGEQRLDDILAGPPA